MPIQTPLVNVMSPVNSTNNMAGADDIFNSFLQGQQNSRANQETELMTQQLKQQMAEKQAQAKKEAELQRLSNIGQAAATGLEIVGRNPEKAEEELRDYIAMRRKLLPELGFQDMSDTDELEQTLNKEGVVAAQDLMTTTLDTIKSAGIKLPPPTTPNMEETFTAIGASGKPEIFFRSDQGPVATNLLAPKKTALVNVGAGGGDKERRAQFGELFKESKNVDRALGQFAQVKQIVADGGLGSIGTSGKVTKGFEKAASAIGGLARNAGIIDDFDEGSIVASGLKGTPLGEQADRNAKVSSLITNLAFAVAQSQNPGGRITDKDFEAAVKTIGANADNPDQLTAVINQFGQNLLNQYETDVQRTGDAFGFTESQFKALTNIPSRKSFNGDKKPTSQKSTTGASSQFKEGQVAVNPKTGEKLVLKNGKWVKM